MVFIEAQNACGVKAVLNMPLSAACVAVARSAWVRPAHAVEALTPPAWRAAVQAGIVAWLLVPQADRVPIVSAMATMLLMSVMRVGRSRYVFGSNYFHGTEPVVGASYRHHRLLGGPRVS